MECTLQCCTNRFGVIVYTYASNYTKAQITLGPCSQKQEGCIISSIVKSPKAMPSLEMSSQLQHNQSIKLTQASSPARPMAPCTLADLIAPSTYILTSADIMPESKTLLRKCNVPEDDGNRGKCNKVGEAIVGLSSMYMNLSPSRHIPATGVTDIMIQ